MGIDIIMGWFAKRLLLCCDVAVGLVQKKRLVVEDLSADRY